MTSRSIIITFQFLNHPTREVEVNGDEIKQAVCQAIDEISEDMLDDLDKIRVEHEDQFLMKL